MKKYASILMAVICIGLMTSCEKDPVPTGNTNNTESLVGTSWKYTEMDYDPYYGYTEYSVIITFTSGNAFTWKTYEDDYLEDSETGTYTYKKPTITLTLDEETVSGTVSGNKMTIEGMEFIKQEKETTESLTGTSWKFTEIYDYTEYSDVINFTTATTFTWKGYEDGSLEYTMTGTYTYKKPNLTITLDGETYSGTVSGNKMTIEGMEFIKQ